MRTTDDITASKAVPDLNLIFLSSPDILRAYDACIIFSMRKRDAVYDRDGDGGLLRAQSNDSAQNDRVLRRSIRTQ